MLQEDGGIELFQVQDIIIMKKAKHLLGHLHEGERIRIQILSNIVHAQIFSGIQNSILITEGFFPQYWADEASNTIRKLGEK